MQPPAVIRPMTAHTSATPAKSIMAIRAATRLAARVIRRISKRRPTRSATTPERTPRKKNGAIRAAEATPTMKAEPVISNTSQPNATCSMPEPRA